MSINLQQLLEVYTDFNLVYLKGPLGFGRIYLARTFLSALLKEKKRQEKATRYFLLCESSSFEEDIKNGKRSIEVLYTKDGELCGWESCEGAIKNLFQQSADAARVENLLSVQKFLFENQYELIVVLDDYDIWRKGKKEKDFALYSEVKKSGAHFLLTSQEKIRRELLSEKEKEFLGITGDYKFKELLPLDLPTAEEAAVIIKALWQELGPKNVILDAESTKKIDDIAGHYPFLLSALVKVLARSIALKLSDDDWKPSVKDAKRFVDDRKLSAEDMKQLLRHAKNQNEFIHHVHTLWNSLNDSEKQAITLMAISQKSGRSLEDLHRDWVYFTDYKVPTTLKDIREAISKLKNDKFLLEKDEVQAELKIASTALLDYILGADYTKYLLKATKTAAVKDAERFSSKKFLGWWLLSAVLYLIFIISKQIVEVSSGPALWDILGVVVWILPFLYAIINAYKLYKANLKLK